MFRLFILVLVLAVAALCLSGRFIGCSFGSVSIVDLQAQPARWEGQKVRVGGVVGRRFAVLGFAGFTLVDDAGHEIVVIGHSRPARPGQSMAVDGRFVTAFALGNVSLSAILVEDD